MSVQHEQSRQGSPMTAEQLLEQAALVVRERRRTYGQPRELFGLVSQKAGVPVQLLPKLVLKELADNALDAGGTVRVGQLQDGGWYVEDDGPGIAGDPGRSGTTARCSPPRASRPGRHAICSTCWASAVIEHRLEQQITEQILREAQIEEKVAAARQRIDLPMPEELHTTIGAALLDQPAASWRAAIERIADQLLAVQDALDGRQGHGT